MVTDRPKRARCEGAPELASTTSDAPPARGHDRTPADVLGARLTTVAHPLHATSPDHPRGHRGGHQPARAHPQYRHQRNGNHRQSPRPRSPPQMPGPLPPHLDAPPHTRGRHSWTAQGPCPGQPAIPAHHGPGRRTTPPHRNRNPLQPEAHTVEGDTVRPRPQLSAPSPCHHSPDQRQHTPCCTDRQPTDLHLHQKRQPQIGIRVTTRIPDHNRLNSKNPIPTALTSQCRTATDKNQQIISLDPGRTPCRGGKTTGRIQNCAGSNSSAAEQNPRIENAVISAYGGTGAERPSGPDGGISHQHQPCQTGFVRRSRS
jgi:hypothetical protein